MNAQPTGPELWKRKFDPISDWKPAASKSGASSGPLSMISEALEGIEKGKEALTKMLEPFNEEAKAKIKDMVSVADEVASKSSTEARTFLANILSAMAEKLRPKP